MELKIDEALHYGCKDKNIISRKLQEQVGHPRESGRGFLGGVDFIQECLK